MQQPRNFLQSREKLFSFTWYHREELQVLVLLGGLIVFFSRELWVLLSLAGFLIIALVGLYGMRILELWLSKHKKAPAFVESYRVMKQALHGHAVERSRIAMAVLACVVLGLLCIHRIDLANRFDSDATPTDLYWIFFLGWYFWMCFVCGGYLFWLWRNWAHQYTNRIPFLDGMIASLFFYHGLSPRNRRLTYIGTFFLGGAPSYIAYRLSPENPYGSLIAIALIVPVIILNLGGSYYAMYCHKHFPRKESPMTP
ncbi:MAG TPA: hypothetical protein VMU30_02695 [Bacteroidota bacterium]|nr:hypothetical protein [Bacteroidota bacterium]